MLKDYTIKNKVNEKEYAVIDEIIFKKSVFFTNLKMTYRYKPPSSDSLFLYYKKKLIGYIECGKSPEYMSEFGIIFLGILPKYRGNKLGYLLVNEAISKFGHLVNYIYITVPENANFLYNYYESLGFVYYREQYSTKFKSGLFLWSFSSVVNELSKSDEIAKQTKWILLRFKTKKS